MYRIRHRMSKSLSINPRNHRGKSKKGDGKQDHKWYIKSHQRLRHDQRNNDRREARNHKYVEDVASDDVTHCTTRLTCRALTLTASSGARVTKASTVNPITRGEIPQRQQSERCLVPTFPRHLPETPAREKSENFNHGCLLALFDSM